MTFDMFNTILLCFVSFFPGLIDASLGMGYGFTVTPALLLLGFRPTKVVPVVLISSIIGDVLSSFFHHRFKNADFSLHSRETKIGLVVGVLGGLGAIFGALITLNLSAVYLRVYIGTLIVVMGFFVLFTRKRKAGVFSWPKMFLLSLVGSFNKGLGGFGFGPIVTSGGLLIGIKEKAAVAIQCLSETFVCIVGILTFVLAEIQLDWYLALPISVGVAASSLPATYFVHKTNPVTLRWLIAVAAITLGVITLMQTFV